MSDYVSVFQYKDNVGISFDVGAEKPFHVGEQMNAAHEMAYMNGYNWDAFFNYYLAENAPDILEGLESNPEAGSYTAFCEPGGENEKKAERFAQIIISLIEHEDELYQIVREKGDEVEWD